MKVARVFVVLAIAVVLACPPVLAQGPRLTPTAPPVLTPSLPLPPAPTPTVGSPVAVPVPVQTDPGRTGQNTASPSETSTPPAVEPSSEGNPPDASPGGSPSPSPGEPPVTQTEALFMLRFLTGKEIRVNTLTPETATALRGFQKDHGLAESGQLDDLTVAALETGVQEGLQSLGYSGAYRPALRAFQSDRGLSTDGEFGRKTSSLLKNALEVRRWQEILKSRLAYGGPLNGKASEPEFKTALEKFQREQGLRVSGKLDGPTRKALLALQAPPAPAPTRAASPTSPAWHWLGGFVLGVAVTALFFTWRARQAQT